METKNRKYFNGELIIARYEATSLLANGFSFKTNNEKLNEWFKEFCKFNRFEDFLYSVIENNSLNGRSLVGLERLGDNVGLLQHYYITTADISCDCVGEPQIVKLDIPVKIDINNYRIERIYTPDKIYSRCYNQETGSELISSAGKYKLSNSLIVQKEYSHNLGFCPIIICNNLPFKTEYYNPQNVAIRLNSAIDTSYTHQLYKFYFQNDSAYATEICNKINEVYENLFDEVITSQTCIITSGGNTNILDSQTNLINEKRREAYKKSGYVFNINGRDIKTDIKNNPNKLNEIYTLIESLVENYFNLCGLSFPKTTGGNNKHSTEIKTLLLRTLETHNLKRRTINRFVEEIIWKSALMSGKFSNEEIDFTFKLNEPNDLSSELERIQTLSMGIQSGIISRLDAIKDFNNLNDKEAEEVNNSIMKDNYNKQEEKEEVVKENV